MICPSLDEVAYSWKGIKSAFAGLWAWLHLPGGSVGLEGARGIAYDVVPVRRPRRRPHRALVPSQKLNLERVSSIHNLDDQFPAGRHARRSGYSQLIRLVAGCEDNPVGWVSGTDSDATAMRFPLGSNLTLLTGNEHLVMISCSLFSSAPGAWACTTTVPDSPAVHTPKFCSTQSIVSAGILQAAWSMIRFCLPMPRLIAPHRRGTRST